MISKMEKLDVNSESKSKHKFTALLWLAVFVLLQTAMLVQLTAWQRGSMDYYKQKVEEYKTLSRSLETACTARNAAGVQNENNGSQVGRPHHHRQRTARGAIDIFRDILLEQEKIMEQICVRRTDLCQAGPTGEKGDKGPTGPKGPTGDHGGVGLKGDRGVTGVHGDSGEPGPNGLEGEDGEQGMRGNNGTQGTIGEGGLVGLKGDRGLPGDRGVIGQKGHQGLPGIAGAGGPRGDTGATGDEGSKGNAGTAGVDGNEGVTGKPGSILDADCLCSDLPPLTGNFSSNVIVKSGLPLSLRCDAGNSTVTWSRLDGALSVHAHKQGNVLKFNHVLKEDQGKYQCSLTSPILGTISKNATIHLKTHSQYDCDFEISCSWTNGHLPGSEHFYWSRITGATPSQNTGPTADHTTGSGYYMYIDTSAHNPGKTAWLQSPELPAHQQRCFMFAYHMYGVGINKLRVRLIIGNTLQTIWQKHGEQGNMWTTTKINIPPETQPSRIIIEGVKGTNVHGDIAIDDLVLTDGPCN